LIVSVIDLTERLLQSIDYTLDFSGIILVEISRHHSDKQVPVVSTICELYPVVGKAEIVENDRNLPNVGLEADIDVHDSLGQLSRVALKGKIKEKHVLELLDIVSIEMVAAEVCPER
jgi:hypothetical protein